MPIETGDSDLVFHASWPPLAQALLRRAIDRHDGWGLLRRLDWVTINLVRLRGLLPWLKGYGRTCSSDAR